MTLSILMNFCQKWNSSNPIMLYTIGKIILYWKPFFLTKNSKNVLNKSKFIKTSSLSSNSYTTRVKGRGILLIILWFSTGMKLILNIICMLIPKIILTLAKNQYSINLLLCTELIKMVKTIKFRVVLLSFE